MARRSSSNRGEVVGVHRIYPFPADNLHGSGRWLCVIEHEDGAWEKEFLPANQPRPQIGDKR